MKKLSIAALALLLPATTMAQESATWFEIPGADHKPSTIYVRRADIQAGRSNQTNAKLWIKVDMTKDMKGIDKVMTLLNVNCPAQTYQKINLVIYNTDGTSLVDNAPREIEAVIPDTNLNTAIWLLCSDRGKN